MTINANIQLFVGMEINMDTVPYTALKIVKIGRKYASVSQSASLPDIDRPQKILFSRIYQEFSIPEVRTVPPECIRSSKRKEIESENRITGVRYIIDIEPDRDPENYMKHNAPGHRYIRTLD